MPIAFACPHCGARMNVPDQFAGQTGPCSSCGRQISIPGTPVALNRPVPAKGGGGSKLLIVLGVVLVSGFACCGVLAALLVPAFGSAKQAAQRQASINNMRVIALALHNYHDVYQTLPPAVVRDANGTPLYSGRVLLLPFLEQQALFNHFDLTKAWNAPENALVASTIVPVFWDPSSKNASNTPRTDYVFVTGPGTVFEEMPSGRMGLGDVTDGLSNTVFLVETSAAGAHWAEPKDMDISQLGAPPPGNRAEGNLIGLMDGAVRWVDRSIDPRTWQGLLTRSGGEVIEAF